MGRMLLWEEVSVDSVDHKLRAGDILIYFYYIAYVCTGFQAGASINAVHLKIFRGKDDDDGRRLLRKDIIIVV